MNAEQIYKSLPEQVFDTTGDAVSVHTVTEQDIERILAIGRRQGLELACAMYVPDGNPQIWRDKVVNALEELSNPSSQP